MSRKFLVLGLARFGAGVSAQAISRVSSGLGSDRKHPIDALSLQEASKRERLLRSPKA